MKQGEIWTLQGEGYASKPRPVLIIQGAHLDDFNSVVLCLISSFPTDNPMRIHIEPSSTNNLNKTSYVMIDKIYSAPKDELGKRIGKLTNSEWAEVTKALKDLLQLP
ncbi:MAG: type II toxin-antitoxin system PemK/MazF family toxin [Actinomycetaceae bacterium]|nr:type II toxin-antitoxin system PemK/MazF family toxin [Actinomycetaceae bacterium]